MSSKREIKTFKPSLEFYRSMYKKNGRVKPIAPRWAQERQNMETSFIPYYSTTDSFRSEVDQALSQLEALKHPIENCPVPFGDDPSLPDYSEVTSATIPEAGLPLNEVITEMVELFVGMANSSHPLSQSNVLPNPNRAAIIAMLLSNYTSQNFIEGENAWNTSKAEMETAAMISNLIEGWSPTLAGGVFSYGGSACYLYAIKYALSSVLEPSNSRCDGVRVDGKVFASQQGHYAKMNSTDWLGLGMDNIVDVETDDATNAMDLEDLEQKMHECYQNQIPIIAIVCTTGTTDAFAIDPVREVAALVAKYPNPVGYNKTIIYADSAIGWVYLMFRYYNWEENPLDFTDVVKTKLQESYTLISELEYADCIALDFHKTGWTPYATSMFMVKDLPTFKRLMSRPGSPYLANRVKYFPGQYSLEVSRSGAPALSAWSTLRFFGQQGYQALVGGILEMSIYLRELIDNEPSMVVVNGADYGFVTLLRVYPETVLDAKAQYQKELSDPSDETKAELKYHNEYQAQIADQIWAWLRTGNQENGLYAPYTTYTSGFRTTEYEDDIGGEGVVYALKSYPMNVNVSVETMNNLLECFKIGRQRVEDGISTDLPNPPIGPPYDVEFDPIQCDGNTASRTKISNMISGVPGNQKKRLGKGVRKPRC